jgi:hypothetical protein
MDIPLDAVKAIYRRAIDTRAGDGEGAAWWAAVATEVIAIIRAENSTAAAAIIAWWHHDWSQVGDTAKAAASRVRRAARDEGRLNRKRPMMRTMKNAREALSQASWQEIAGVLIATIAPIGVWWGLLQFWSAKCSDSVGVGLSMGSIDWICGLSSVALVLALGVIVVSYGHGAFCWSIGFCTSTPPKGPRRPYLSASNTNRKSHEELAGTYRLC